MSKPASMRQGRNSMARRRPPRKTQPLVEVFASNVRRIRREKGMSVATLARLCGDTPDFVDAVETARRKDLTLADLETFTAALEVDITEVVER